MQKRNKLRKYKAAKKLKRKAKKRITIKSDLTGKFRIIKSVRGNKLLVEYKKLDNSKSFREATQTDVKNLKKSRLLKTKVV